MLSIPYRTADGSPPLSGPEAILKRRATRHFDTTRPLPDDLLKSILRLATMAPSSFNLQPWRFLVIRSENNRARLRAASYGQPKIGEAPVVVVVLGSHTPHETYFDEIVQKQVDLGVMTAEIGQRTRVMAARAVENVPNIEAWTMRSSMTAAMTLLIAAESLGVDSAPMEGFEPEKVKAAFGIPDDHTICCLIALGFAAPGSVNEFPGRLDLDEVCYLEHFGAPWTLGD